MYSPDKKEFMELAKTANLIPVYRELIADMETPVSAFMKVADGDYAFLLESVEYGEKVGRYSFVGLSSGAIFSSRGKTVKVRERGAEREYETATDPIEELKAFMGRYRPGGGGGLPRFYGGAVGYLGYEMVRFIEDIPDTNPDDLNLPESFFMITDTVLIFDHVKRTVKVVCNAGVGDDPSASYREATERIDAVVGNLSRAVVRPPIELAKPRKAGAVGSNFSKDEFQAAVVRAKEYIARGDVIQVVLSQRLSARAESHPFDVYRVLRSINPSPYMFYLRFGDLCLVGSSPEVMVRGDEGDVELRPIAGTRPRGENEEEDVELERELLSSEKECAEHIMLVDLGRNDIGRVCKKGTVRVSEMMVIERYSHVMHIVSDVVGRLRDDKDNFDLLRATFPAGTVSGAPKIRAMEIIDELENLRRGPYAGAVGYFSFSGNLDTCITIRTIIIKDGTAYVQAGAGIVADSDPAEEYRETMNKAKAMLTAIDIANSIRA